MSRASLEPSNEVLLVTLMVFLNFIWKHIKKSLVLHLCEYFSEFIFLYSGMFP